MFSARSKQKCYTQDNLGASDFSEASVDERVSKRFTALLWEAASWIWEHLGSKEERERLSLEAGAKKDISVYAIVRMRLRVLKNEL